MTDTDSEWKQLNLKLPADLVYAIKTEAEERGIGVRKFVEMGMEDYMSRLIPVDEIQWTRKEEVF